MRYAAEIRPASNLPKKTVEKKLKARFFVGFFSIQQLIILEHGL